MHKPKNQVREVLYRDQHSVIEVVLLTKRTSQGCTHNAYLKRHGLCVGPSMFLGFTTENNVDLAAEKVTDLIKALVTTAILNCYQIIYKGLE